MQFTIDCAKRGLIVSEPIHPTGLHILELTTLQKPLPVVGRIVEIWRYPISSVGGERLARALVHPDGVVGDRQYGLIETSTGRPAAPENDVRWRKALHLKAGSLDSDLPFIVFPDGRMFSVDDGALNDALTEFFGFATAIAAYEHTRHRLGFPLTRYRHPHFPLHFLTTKSLARLAALCRRDAIDSRRFRPTAVIEVENGDGFIENEWTGRHLRIGILDAKAEEDAKRCGVTFVSQPGIDEDPEILRTILRNNKRHLGIYCSSDVSATIEQGDEVSVDT